MRAPWRCANLDTSAPPARSVWACRAQPGALDEDRPTLDRVAVRAEHMALQPQPPS